MTYRELLQLISEDQLDKEILIKDLYYGEFYPASVDLTYEHPCVSVPFGEYIPLGSDLRYDKAPIPNGTNKLDNTKQFRFCR